MEFIWQNIFFVIAAVISGSMLLFMSFRGQGGKDALTPAQATQMINRQDAVLIDISEPGEFLTGHLPESRNIPLGQLAARAGELDAYKDTPLILVCQTGVRTAGACCTLQTQGFTKVYSLAGGINAWRAAGLPVRKGEKK